MHTIEDSAVFQSLRGYYHSASVAVLAVKFVCANTNLLNVAQSTSAHVCSCTVLDKLWGIECGSSSSWFYVNVGHPRLGFMYQHWMWVILVLVSCECGWSSSWFYVSALNVGHPRLGFMYQHRMWVILVLVSCECGSSSSWFYVSALNVGHPRLGFMYQHWMWVILVLVLCECGSSSSWFYVSVSNVGHPRLGFMWMWVILVLVLCISIECGSSSSWFHVNRFIFANTCATNDFHTSTPVTLTFAFCSFLIFQIHKVSCHLVPCYMYCWHIHADTKTQHSADVPFTLNSTSLQGGRATYSVMWVVLTCSLT